MIMDDVQKRIDELNDELGELLDKQHDVASMYRYTLEKEINRLSDITEDTCRICLKNIGIGVIVFDSFMRGKCSSYICESCLGKIQK